MKISPKIQTALNEYLNANGFNYNDLSRKLDVHHTAVMRWANGTAKTIRPGHWSKLEPLISPYMQAEFPAQDCPEICKKLSDTEREAVKLFGELPGADKLRVMADIQQRHDDALKKSDKITLGTGSIIGSIKKGSEEPQWLFFCPSPFSQLRKSFAPLGFLVITVLFRLARAELA